MKVAGVLIVGLLLGLTGGLIYAWFIAPVEYYDTFPPLLDATYRHDWIRMVTWTYGAEGNWERTQIRLSGLSDDEVRVAVADVLEGAVAEGRSISTLQRMARLALEYDVDVPAAGIYAEGGVPSASGEGGSEGQTPPPPTPTVPTATMTPRPSATPTPTQIPLPTPAPTELPQIQTPEFRIISQTLSCDAEPSIAVSLEISRTVREGRRERQEQVGEPMRELWLTWDGGADRAITGFKPEHGLGYADFTVQPGRSYNLYLDSPTGLPLFGFQIEPCLPSEGTGWMSRSLILLKEELSPETAGTATPTPSPTSTATPTP